MEFHHRESGVMMPTAGPANVARGFDYSLLTAEVAAEVRAAADRVRAANSRITSSILDTGRELRAVKKRLGHGHFGPWLKAEFGWSDRTANYLMRAADCFSDKSEIVAELQPSVVYALASPSIPEEVREQVVTGLSSGALKPEKVGDLVRQTMQEVAEARRSELAKRRRAGLPPKELKKELDREKRREADLKQTEVNRLRREIVLDKLVTLLQARLREEDRQWLTEVEPDFRYEIQNLVQRVLAAPKPDGDPGAS
jgi:hypothetical protein